MLVFLSDVHLTDEKSATMSPDAFKKFAQYLEDMADNAQAKSIEIVFLGDIFDVIRCACWSDSNVRPWSSEDEKDGAGKGLKDYVINAVKSICENPINKDSKEHLKKFKNESGKNVKYTYIIGNHDWLINRYGETRKMVAEFLELDDPAQSLTKPFRDEAFWADYKVFGRHGDVYDPFNFEGNRDASSLGDAIVIELINKFPSAVEQAIGINTNPALIAQLKEIDNVKPIVDIPLWVQGACRRVKEPAIREEVKKVWNHLVDNFLNAAFVREHDKWLWPDLVDALQLAFKISKVLSFKDIASLPLRKLQPKDTDYRDKAFNEDSMRRNEAEFVVYGHTHDYKIEPLDQVVMSDNKVLNKMYFNSGTWRKVQARTAYDKENQEFLNWHVMTFLAFYLESERAKKDDGKKHRKFEVWNGYLGNY